MKFMQEYEKKEERSGKIKGYICLISAIVVIILIVMSVIFGYFVSLKDNSGDMHDGFGRLLDDVPGALSLILPQWAGHLWFIIDCLILLGMIVVADRLLVKSKNYFKGVKNVDF